ASFKRTDVWKHGKIYYNETVEVADDYYDSLEKYGVNTLEDVKIPYILGMKEVSYKAAEVHEDFSNTYDVAVKFDRRYLEKVMNRLSFYHFSNLQKYLPLLKSREEFLGENWLNIFNRTIYVTIPQTMDSGALTPTEKLEILERYLVDVSKQIKAGFSKERGTGKSWLTIKEYITNYRKRVTNYDTGKYIQHEPQNVQCHELKEDYFVYDVAIVYNTEKQLINRIAEQVEEIEEVYDDVYLIRMDENKHRESAKSNKLKLHQFGRNHDEVNLAGFQPNFILYLQGT